MRKSHYDDVDQALLKWFPQQRLNNVTISGAILKTKAEEFGNKIHGEFVCSKSWIDRWKVRHNISSGKLVGEVASVDNTWSATGLPQFGRKLEKILAKMTSTTRTKQVFFYKLTPDRTLKFKGEQC
ncbi:Tc5 transposase DNA-binding domain [Popillia japonica]|uniref:Tc5 transposase DNA-binding domain n=1 Tax=Popillia japonica TaxID=7064 RepID=A0AAW1IBV4_POPJA